MDCYNTTDTYNITTKILWKYYSHLQVYRPAVPTCHYNVTTVTTVTTGFVGKSQSLLMQSYSPPQICQEEREIGEITDTPSPSLMSSLPVATLAMNQSAFVGTTVPSSGSNTSLPRGPSAKQVDFAISHSVSSSSQVRHSLLTHPRSFNTSLLYCQPLPSASTLPSAAHSTGVPPPTTP